MQFLNNFCSVFEGYAKLIKVVDTVILSKLNSTSILFSISLNL